MATTRRVARPLRLKLSLLVGLLAVAPVAAMGWLLADVNARAVTRAARELQLALTGDVARTIEGTFTDAQNALDAVGRTLADASRPEDARLALAITLVEAAESLDHAAVYDAAGRLIDTIRERGAADVASPEALPAALAHEAEAQGVATGAGALSAGGVRVLLVVPLQVGESAARRPTGYVASQVALTAVQARVDRLVEAHFGEWPDGLVVVGRDLQVLARPHGAPVGGPASALASPLIEGLSPEALAADFAAAGETAGPDGTPMVSLLVGVPTRRWMVLAQVPQAVAYASLTRMHQIIGVGGALVALVALLTSLAFARRLTEPLRALTAFADDLAARRFDRRVAVPGRDELAVLAEALSGAAGELQASEARIRAEIEIRADLGRYLPAELVEKVVRREQDMALGGRRVAVSVLFADVVGFTALARALPPEQVVTLLNELFALLTGIVFRHGGTLDKFVGDCVMALWGAPSATPDHAARALACAEDMMRWLEAGNAAWERRFGARIQLGIGVSSGEAVVGNIGTKARMDYTAIGDVVNLAARLEGLAAPQQILTTAATRAAAGEGFDYVEVGPRLLPGRVDPVLLYEVRA